MSETRDAIVVEAQTWRAFVVRCLRLSNFFVGAVITITVVIAASLSFVWTPHSATEVDVAKRFIAPGAVYWLGTDQLGRDVFSMIMVGARNSIAVALVAVGIGMGVGVPLGLWAAARRGAVDEMLMRTNDVIFAFPALVSAVMIAAVFGPGIFNAIIAVGIFNIPVFARLTRSGALSLWTRAFIMAARVAGKGALRISLEHILPNILNLLIVQATIQFSLGILAEAGLSFVGLGTLPPDASWGRMLREGQTLIYLAPHVAFFPGVAIVLTVLGLNLLGDGLRDALDPRLRRRLF